MIPDIKKNMISREESKSGNLAMSFMDGPLDSIKHRRKKGNSQSTVVKRGSVGVIRNRVLNLFQSCTCI